MEFRGKVNCHRNGHRNGKLPCKTDGIRIRHHCKSRYLWDLVAVPLIASFLLLGSAGCGSVKPIDRLEDDLASWKHPHFGQNGECEMGRYRTLKYVISFATTDQTRRSIEKMLGPGQTKEPPWVYQMAKKHKQGLDSIYAYPNGQIYELGRCEGSDMMFMVLDYDDHDRLKSSKIVRSFVSS
jgi:hypothetical protein